LLEAGDEDFGKDEGDDDLGEAVAVPLAAAVELEDLPHAIR
jgi:hypothetical protein